jgi:hypothetical protein
MYEPTLTYAMPPIFQRSRDILEYRSCEICYFSLIGDAPSIGRRCIVVLLTRDLLLDPDEVAHENVQSILTTFCHGMNP